MLINGIGLPKSLQLYWLPPREVNMVDTMEVWKQSGWSNTWLETIAVSLGIKTPKIVDEKGNKVDGSYVKDMYYKENRLEDISKYCARDVLATYKVYKRVYKLMD